MFSSSRKLAQQTARQLLAGHCTLITWWTLRHAGVLDAMVKEETAGNDGLNPLVHATRTNMAPDMLNALIDYLASVGLVAIKNEVARLTAEGHALLDHEDGVLELIRAYQPVLDMSEHLLARLKTGASPAGAASSDAQAKRLASEVFPAIKSVIAGAKCKHLLDIACGSGELLIFLAKEMKSVVGVGIGADAITVRRANAAINAADLEKRLIAVSANPVETCTETQRTFERIGISRQLWKELDCLIATSVLSNAASAAGPEAEAAVKSVLGGVRKHFPKAHLLLAEPAASPRFDRNYYAPEMSLLLRLTRTALWTPERWRGLLETGGFKIVAEKPLITDGMTLFLAKPG